jgi:cysteine-rich repeat protein
MAGVAVAACSSTIDKQTPSSKSSAKDGENVGTVGLSLQPVAGITINSVHYVVTQGMTTVVEGDLPTPGTSDNFSFGIPLPVGTGYSISLSGESAETGDNITCTGSFGPFDVAPNMSTQFSMTLTCVDNTNGQIITEVDVETDACPRLVVDYAVALPSTGTVPSDPAIQVLSSARDLDNAAATITYAWSIVDAANAGVGSFAPANAQNSTFTCASNGDGVVIQVTANNGECSKSLKTVISCVSETCGNGVLDPGETCDTALDPTCPSDCTRVCGDGVVESGEECDLVPQNPALCTIDTCQTVDAVCGDNLVTPPETCDDGNTVSGDGCSSTCRLEVAVCGDGIVNGTDECDDAGPSRTCSGECEVVSTAACVDCEQAGDCFASSDNCLGPAATPFTTAQQNLCFDVMQCIQDTNCLDGTGSLGRCYCGTLSTSACGAAPFDLSAMGAPNGPCAAIMQAGNPAATSNSQILAGLTAKGTPAGAAGQRLNCQKNDPACAPLCGVE